LVYVIVSMKLSLNTGLLNEGFMESFMPLVLLSWREESNFILIKLIWHSYLIFSYLTV